MSRKKRLNKPPKKQKAHQRGKKSPAARKQAAVKTEKKTNTPSSTAKTQQKTAGKTAAAANPSKQVKPVEPLTFSQLLKQFALLMRLDRPIGILLLLWPTYWGLWLAAEGLPSIKNLIIFTLGCIVMRSAGCVINDYADRHIDGHVQRTKQRPIVSGMVSPRAALLLFMTLCALAFVLVLFTNTYTIMLSGGGLLLAFCYPFTKRYTHMPQVVLGAAFAWSIPMAFAAETGAVVLDIWLVYLTVVLWAVVYDTFYAMVDRDDDLKIGVKSTAILFGDADRAITSVLQGMIIFTLALVGQKFELGTYYYTSLAGAALLFVYQQYLIKEREKEKCFKAFLNNNWVGLIIFIGIAADYWFKAPVTP